MKKTLLILTAILSILNPSETLGSELTSLAPGTNEVLIEHDGQTRRLIVTTPKTYDRQVAYPILFCFHGAGGKAEGPSNRWSPHADKHGLIVISAEAVQPIKDQKHLIRRDLRDRADSIAIDFPFRHKRK